MGEAREATGRLSAVRMDESVNLIYDTIGEGGRTGGGSGPTKQDVILQTAGLENDVTPRWLVQCSLLSRTGTTTTAEPLDVYVNLSWALII